MKKVILKWSYYEDIILCPDYVAENLQEYQKQFDIWINQPEQEKKYQVTIMETGEKALCFDSDAFVNWLNEHVVGKDEQVTYDQRDIEKSNKKKRYPTIYF